MQTFLPYPDFLRAARCLDDKRCMKQVVEARQILDSIENPNCWYRHPAVKMWIGFEDALRLYFNTFLSEWKSRGKRIKYEPLEVPDRVTMPPWLGDVSFHAAHRARLLDKNPDHYGQFGWTEEPNSHGYLWPTVKADGSVFRQDLTKLKPKPFPPRI